MTKAAYHDETLSCGRDGSASLSMRMRIVTCHDAVESNAKRSCQRYESHEVAWGLGVALDWDEACGVETVRGGHSRFFFFDGIN